MLAQTQWLSLQDVAQLMGRRRAGRDTKRSTVRDWCLDGLRGVRLRSELRGGVRMTTLAWLDEFFLALNRARDRELASRRTAMRSPAKAARDAGRARSELERLGAR